VLTAGLTRLFAGHPICTQTDVLRPRRPATLIVALGLSVIAASRCSHPRTTPTPPDASAALRAALKAKTPAFAGADGERGHHIWREEQRFYEQNGYQLV
jgi:hypothetical protein